jgi:hypothetical protein
MVINMKDDFCVRCGSHDIKTVEKHLQFTFPKIAVNLLNHRKSYLPRNAFADKRTYGEMMTADKFRELMKKSIKEASILLYSRTEVDFFSCRITFSFQSV